MKRLSNICIPCEGINPNEFNTVYSKDKVFFTYTEKRFYYDKGYLVKTSLELPYLDIYEIRAMSKQGVVCGYAFDILCKEPLVDSNFIICASKGFNLSLSDIGKHKTCLKLNYKLKGCNVYSIDGSASMLTVSNKADTKFKMDM